jgi:RNA polymerase I-specific transcription initiation factor RRN3
MLSPVLANGSNEDGSYFGGAKSPVQAGYSISISDIIQITTNGFSELYSFFPFDPYRLPSSSKCLDGMYREWGMVAIEEDDDDEEAGEGEGEGEGEEGEEEDVEEGDNVEHNDVHKLLHAQEDGAGNQDGSSNSEDEDGDSTDSDSEAKFGMPMELGSVRDQDQDRDGLNVSVSFGKMSISPDHRQGFVGRAN